MPRYAVTARRPRADWMYDDNPLVPSLEVDDAAEVDTGLVTATGEKIMRIANPLGFGRDEDW